MKKRVLSMLLVLILVLGMVPVTAFAATDLTVSGGRVDIVDAAVGPYTLKNVDVYKQSDFSAVSIVSATQDGNTINVVLSADTDPSLPIQAGFSGSGQGILQHSNNKCTLSNGSGMMTVAIAVKMGPQLVGSTSYTINFSMPKGEECDVDLPAGEGYTVTGAEAAYKGSSYSFQVAVDDAYDGTNMVVKVNGEPITVNNGSYIVENVTGDLTITVEGVVKKEVCNVTLPTGEGYTASGAATVYKGDSYSFIVSVAEGYTGENMVVKANEETLTVSNGKYTVSEVTENLTIIVEGVAKREVCSISLPTGEGYTVSGETTVYKGDSYSFTVSVAEGYVSDALEVQVNGTPITATNGNYTISNVTENVTITVTGVKKEAVGQVTFSVSADNTLLTENDKLMWNVSANLSDIATGAENMMNDYFSSYRSYDASTGEEQTTVLQLLLYALQTYYNGGTEFVPNDWGYMDSDTFGLPLAYYESDSDWDGTYDSLSLYGLWGYGNGSDSFASVDIFVNGVPQMTIDYNYGYAMATTPNKIVLKDGDHVDIAIYNYYDGFTTKYLNYFTDSQGNFSNTFTVDSGETLTLNSMVTFYDMYGSETPDYMPGVATHGNYSGIVHYGRSPFDGDSNVLSDYDTGSFTLTAEQLSTPGTWYVWYQDTPGWGTLSHPALAAIVVEGGEDVPTIEPTTIYTGNSKPSSMFGYVSSIAVNDVQVEEYIWVGDDAYVTLAADTADDATAFIDFTTGGSSISMTDAQVALTDGKADAAYTAKASIFGTWNFTLHFSNEGFVPTLASGVSGTAAETVYTGDTYSLDLAPLFSDLFGKTLTYWVKEGEGSYTQLTGSTYSITPDAEGTKVLTFKANNGRLDSEDTYVLTLTVQDLAYKTVTVQVPETITPTFYETGSFGTDGVDVPGEELTAVKGQTGEGLTSYTIRMKDLDETISVRAAGWGGMAIDAVVDSTVTLRPVQVSLADLNGKALEGTVSVAYGENKAAAGADGKYLLAVGQEYAYTSAPTDTDYQTLTEKAVLEAGTTTKTVTLKLGINNAITITATTGAKVQLYNYDINKYYVATECDPKIIKDNGDGSITYYYNADGNCLIYRVSMEGKITKMGYFGWNQTSVNAVYDADDKSDTYRLDDYSGTGTANSGLTEDSVLLNINSRNNLQMSVGQTKTLKAYRAWEIIKVSYQNYILTPDFTYTILSGSDVVSLTEKESPSTADGDWMTLTALKEGVAVIEVTYGAVEASGGSYDGIYGASDPARTGIVVVQVGGGDSSVDFGIDGFSSIGKSGSNHITYDPNNERAWDAEFDTLYFTGSSGQLSLAPTADSTIREVAVSHDKGTSWTALTGSNGTYTAKIVSGNNIIRVTTASGTAYQVVRGDKITVKFTEVADKSDGDGIVEAGETIRVSLVGLHTPIPKMSGNYNPGFGGNYDGYSSHHLNYTSNGTAIYGPGSQYNFITVSNYVEITMPEDGSKVTLSDGYIGVGVIGLTNFTTGGDSHRNIPDTGCGTRENITTYHTRSVLPEITVYAGDASAPNTAPIVRADAVTEGSIYADQNYALNPDTLFQDLDGNPLTFTVSVDGGTPTAAPVDYKFTPGRVGTFVLTFTASDGKETAQHSVTVTVTERPAEEDKDETFGLTEDQIAGYVTVSFEDYGVRVAGETGLKYPVPLGSIVAPTKVPFIQGENMAQVTKRLLDHLGMGCSYSGSLTSGFYLGAISNFEVGGTPYGSMGEFDAGSGSGWMVTLNGWFINMGASEFTAKNGDVITWKYTCQLGKDIGDTSYYKSVEDVIDLIDEIGTVTLDSQEAIEAAREAYDRLTAAERKRVPNYDVLTAAEEELEKLQKETDEAAAKEVKDLIDKIVTGSQNFEETVENAKKAYDKLTDAQKKLVTNYAKLADALKELASEEDKEAAEEVEKLINAIGTVTKDSKDAIKAAREAYEKLTDDQKALVNNLLVLEAAEEKLAELTAAGAALDIYKTTGDYLETLGTPSVGSVGGEWMVIGLARSDRKVPDAYYDNVLTFVRENIDENERLHNSKSTENARVILALTALGKDVTNVDGHDLLAGLNDMAYVKKQGINGPIWALIAFDSGNYPTPDGDVSRESLLQEILGAQLADHGWALTGEDADPDMTGMAIQALAPYYESDDAVRTAVDNALKALSQMQNADGSFSSVDGKNAESIAQVIVALTALGVDPDADSRFIKNGVSAFDALCAYYVEGGGFRHLMDGDLDGMATEQSYYAMASYYRMLDKKNSLYDMTDVVDMGGVIPAEETTVPSETEPADTEPAAAEPEEAPQSSNSFPWWLLIVILLAIIALIVILILKKKIA